MSIEVANDPRTPQSLLSEQAVEIIWRIKLGIDRAIEMGVNCDYPECVNIDGMRYSFSVICDEARRRMSVDIKRIKGAPRVIKRVMTDGYETKDGVG